MHTTKPTLFGREPALIMGAVNALLAVAVGFGLDVTPEQVALINAGVAAIVAVIVRTQVTPAAEVAERVEDGVVIAGPANEMVPTGAVVRDLGHTAGEDDGTGVLTVPEQPDETGRHLDHDGDGEADGATRYPRG